MADQAKVDSETGQSVPELDVVVTIGHDARGVLSVQWAKGGNLLTTLAFLEHAKMGVLGMIDPSVHKKVLPFKGNVGH